MKRNSYNLDAHCLDWLDTFDARQGQYGKSEMVRTGVTLASGLESKLGTESLCQIAKLIRNGQTEDALDALHSQLMGDALGGVGDVGETSSTVDDSAPSPTGADDSGDVEDDVGNPLPPVPGMAGDEELEGAPEESERAPKGDPESEERKGPGASGQDSDGRREGLGSGMISRALGLNK